MSPRRGRYQLLDEAAADLKSIVGYISRERPAAAKRVLQALRRTFRQLANNPCVGTLREDLGPAVRYITAESPAHRYVVFFRPANTEADVAIFAVIDGSQDWEMLLRRPGD